MPVVEAAGWGRLDFEIGLPAEAVKHFLRDAERAMFVHATSAFFHLDDKQTLLLYPRDNVPLDVVGAHVHDDYLVLGEDGAVDGEVAQDGVGAFVRAVDRHSLDGGEGAVDQVGVDLANNDLAFAACAYMPKVSCAKEAKGGLETMSTYQTQDQSGARR